MLRSYNLNGHRPFYLFAEVTRALLPSATQVQMNTFRTLLYTKGRKGKDYASLEDADIEVFNRTYGATWPTRKLLVLYNLDFLNMHHKWGPILRTKTHKEQKVREEPVEPAETFVEEEVVVRPETTAAEVEPEEVEPEEVEILPEGLVATLHDRLTEIIRMGEQIEQLSATLRSLQQRYQETSQTVLFQFFSGAPEKGAPGKDKTEVPVAGFSAQQIFDAIAEAIVNQGAALPDTAQDALQIVQTYMVAGNSMWLEDAVEDFVEEGVSLFPGGITAQDIRERARALFPLAPGPIHIPAGLAL